MKNIISNNNGLTLENTTRESQNIRSLINQELEYSNLIRKYGETNNPSILKDLNKKFTSLCRGWDSIRFSNKI